MTQMAKSWKLHGASAAYSASRKIDLLRQRVQHTESGTFWYTAPTTPEKKWIVLGLMTCDAWHGAEVLNFTYVRYVVNSSTPNNPPGILAWHFGHAWSVRCPFDMWDCGAGAFGGGGGGGYGGSFGYTTWDGDLVALNAANAAYNSSGAAAIDKGLNRYINSLFEWKIECANGTTHTVPGQVTDEQAGAICSGEMPSDLVAMYFVSPKDSGNPEKLKTCIQNANKTLTTPLSDSWDFWESVGDIVIEVGLNKIPRVGEYLALAWFGYRDVPHLQRSIERNRAYNRALASYDQRIADCNAAYGPVE